MAICISGFYDHELRLPSLKSSDFLQGPIYTPLLHEAQGQDVSRLDASEHL